MKKEIIELLEKINDETALRYIQIIVRDIESEVNGGESHE